MGMGKLSVNTSRFDPYRNFKFKIKWDGQYVAGLNKCTALNKTTIEGHEGSASSMSNKLPGKTKYEALTLSAGVTHDDAFEKWANLVNNYKGDAAMSPKNFRKDIIVDVFNEAGQKVISYNVFRCWVSEYQALPDLDANANVVMIQTIKLENEGWEETNR